jgi:acetyltransferase
VVKLLSEAAGGSHGLDCPVLDSRSLSAIYSIELAREVTIRDGARFRARPIRPEDEPALIEMAEQCTPNDIRLRFFHPIKNFSHDAVSRVCQIDYDREMALIAEEAGSPLKTGPIYGIVHLVTEPGGERAEFANSRARGHERPWARL